MLSYTARENHIPYADGHGTFPTDLYRTTEPLLSVTVDTDTVSTDTQSYRGDGQ
ncbi:MAG: hypothetical protein J07HN6_00701 [Halonotius sp. J07HN6]|jgi:hypothetical protein|nr:MAG: hypothetical protein J07HN6_00701 [Halonotius sp. J07HN6]